MVKQVNTGNFLPFRKYFVLFVRLNNISIRVTERHLRVCDKLQLVVLGRLKKRFVVVNIPPRFGKTKMMEALISWYLAYFADAHFIYTSYAAPLACNSVRYIRETLGREWYTKLFDTRLGILEQATHFNTSREGVVYGTGTSGSITGFGAGLKRPYGGGFIVIDDPAKPNESLSEQVAKDLQFWLTNTLLSRCNSPQTPIILCAQRLSPEDLCGYVLREYPEDVEHICVDAEDEQGNSIMDDTVTTAQLVKLKHVDEFTYWSQYRQKPINPGGNMIKVDTLQSWSGDMLEWEDKILTCDTAMKKGQENDFWVIQAWCKRQGAAYLIDQFRQHCTAPEFLSAAATFYKKHMTEQQYHPVSRFLIEEAASGPAVIQSLNVLGIPATGIVRVKDKAQRVNDILSFVHTGMVYADKNASWWGDFRAELSAFRQDLQHKHDDQVDAFADGVANLLGTGFSLLDVLGGRN